MLEIRPATSTERQALGPELIDRRARLHLADPGRCEEEALASAEAETDGILDDSPKNALLLFFLPGHPEPAGHTWLCTEVGNYPEEGLTVIRDFHVRDLQRQKEALSLVLGSLETAGARLVVTRVRADDSTALAGFEAGEFRRISMLMMRTGGYSRPITPKSLSTRCVPRSMPARRLSGWPI